MVLSQTIHKADSNCVDEIPFVFINLSTEDT